MDRKGQGKRQKAKGKRRKGQGKKGTFSLWPFPFREAVTAAVGQMITAPKRRKARTRGGKSELRRAVRRVTPGQGNLKESGTENTQPFDSPLRGSLRAGRRNQHSRARLERTPKG